MRVTLNLASHPYVELRPLYQRLRVVALLLLVTGVVFWWVLRTQQQKAAEAHGRAEMMEFNYLVEQKAVNRVAGKYSVDFTRMPAAIASLAKELLTIEATGDRQRAEAWFNRYDKMPAELAEAMKPAAKLPVDVWPMFSFKTMD